MPQIAAALPKSLARPTILTGRPGQQQDNVREAMVLTRAPDAWTEGLFSSPAFLTHTVQYEVKSRRKSSAVGETPGRPLFRTLWLL